MQKYGTRSFKKRINNKKKQRGRCRGQRLLKITVLRIKPFVLGRFLFSYRRGFCKLPINKLPEYKRNNEKMWKLENSDVDPSRIPDRYSPGRCTYCYSLK